MRFIDPKTGRMKTQYEVDQEDEAAKQRALEETYKRPYFTIIERHVIPDWTGHKYVTTHKCFGSPCKKWGFNPFGKNLEFMKIFI